MSTENTPPPAQQPAVQGLLSKVVKFVSNPTKDWKDLDALDQPSSHTEEDVNAQQLRERIERKRRNDFIRKAEFAHLRKIINARKKQRTPAVPSNVLVNASGAKASSGSADELRGSPQPPKSRSGTLKKINEIEAQLSRQWWQAGKQGAATASAAIEGDGVHGPSSTGEAVSDFFLTGSSLFFADAVAAEVRAARRRMQGPAEAHKEEDDMVAKLRHIDEVLAFFGFQEDFVHQADLEEAAILFSSHRIAEAEKVLVDVIRKNANAPAEQQVQVWLALLDMYRAIGKQDRFDAVAIDFAQRFDRSPPIWISIPEQLGENQAAAETKRPFSWMSAPDLTQQSVATADALRQRGAAPFQLNWSRLKSIQPDALESLIAFIHALAAQPGLVQFTEGERLHQLVQGHTVVSDASVDRHWWLLRLALLRLAGDSEAFDVVALDYTVTYEESPPAWVAPAARFSEAGAGNPEAEAADAADVGQAPRFVMRKAALQGRIAHDATDALEAAVAALAEGAPIEIDCSRLIVMDFAAAGSTLNWAAAQQSAGRVVVFSELHRLVAVFFNVIGINEHARVVPRKT